jgi:hypothetical protein
MAVSLKSRFDTAGSGRTASPVRICHRLAGRDVGSRLTKVYISIFYYPYFKLNLLKHMHFIAYVIYFLLIFYPP